MKNPFVFYMDLVPIVDIPSSADVGEMMSQKHHIADLKDIGPKPRSPPQRDPTDKFSKRNSFHVV